jgi:hypothetical protein
MGNFPFFPADRFQHQAVPMKRRLRDSMAAHRAVRTEKLSSLRAHFPPCLGGPWRR